MSSTELHALKEAIASKLEANDAVLLRSLAYGRLSWRRRPAGGFEVKLQPEL